MNAHLIPFSLDLDRQDSQVYVNVRKGETEAKLSATITGNCAPYVIADGSTAKLKATLPGGTHKTDDCTISNGRIEIVLDSSYTETAGRYRAHFEMSGGEGSALPTPAFTINVEDPQ